MRVAVVVLVVVVKDCLGIKMAWELRETGRGVGGERVLYWHIVSSSCLIAFIA